MRARRQILSRIAPHRDGAGDDLAKSGALVPARALGRGACEVGRIGLGQSE
jgi:hypothetical protein